MFIKVSGKNVPRAPRFLETRWKLGGGGATITLSEKFNFCFKFKKSLVFVFVCHHMRLSNLVQNLAWSHLFDKIPHIKIPGFLYARILKRHGQMAMMKTQKKYALEMDIWIIRGITYLTQKYTNNIGRSMYSNIYHTDFNFCLNIILFSRFYGRSIKQPDTTSLTSLALLPTPSSEHIPLSLRMMFKSFLNIAHCIS